ncbi:MAG TPA: flagellar assembly protein FliW [Firmicutes bacterium]|nr:flagellar assembly protein FliW [Bacillota bacterium]
MNIQTKFHGEINIATEDIITFPKGLLGFESKTKFVLLNLDETGASVFKVLQSVETPGVSFIVTNPFHFNAGYQFDLNKELVEQLNVQTEQDLTILSIVTIRNNADMTTNLLGPIILHVKNKIGYQIVLEGKTYTTTYPIKVEGDSAC